MFNDLSNLVSGVIISMLASNVDRGFEHQSGQTNDYKIGICCIFEKHAALRSKGKDWLARNQNNASKWDAISTCGVLFYIIKNQLPVLNQCKANIIIIIHEM